MLLAHTWVKLTLSLANYKNRPQHYDQSLFRAFPLWSSCFQQGLVPARVPLRLSHLVASWIEFREF